MHRIECGRPYPPTISGRRRLPRVPHLWAFSPTPSLLLKRVFSRPAQEAAVATGLRIATPASPGVRAEGANLSSQVCSHGERPSGWTIGRVEPWVGVLLPHPTHGVEVPDTGCTVLAVNV